MKKRGSLFTALLLTAVMILSACSGGQAPAPAGDGGNAGQDAAQAQGSDAGAAENVELSILVNMDWFFMDNWGGRPVDDVITRETGVSLNVTRVADDQQLPVLMASNQLPDLVYTDSMLLELSNDNQCYELGEFFRQYAPNMPLPNEQTGIAKRDDGNFYYLVNFWKTQKEWDDPHFLPSVGSSGLMYREDILAETGMQLPTSMDELEALLVRVKELYPSIVPLALYSEGERYTFFINQYMVDSPSYMIAEDNGDWSYFAGTDAYRDGMRTLNRFAQQGLLIPEMFTLMYEQYIQETQSGNVFMWIDDSSNLEMNNNAFQTMGLDSARAAFMKSAVYQEAPYPYVDPSGGWAGTFVTKNNKNPEATARFLEWMTSDEAGKLVGWGIEGQHYNPDSNGYPILTPDVARMWVEDYDKTVRDTGVGAWFFGTNAWYESVRIYAPEENPPMTEYLMYVKSNQKMEPALATLRPNPNTDESAALASLNNTVKTYYPRIIFARDGNEFERIMDELQSQMATQGLLQYNDWAANRWTHLKQVYGIS